MNRNQDRIIYHLSALLVFLTLIFSGCASSSSQVKLPAPVMKSKPTSLDFIDVTTASSFKNLDAEKKLLNESIISGLRQRLLFSDISGNQTNQSSSKGIKVLAQIKEITKVSDNARVWYGGLAGRARILVHVTVSDLSSGRQIEVFEVKGESGKSAFAGTTNEAIQQASEQVVAEVAKLNAQVSGDFPQVPD
jgi:hypothetical protein